LEVPAWFFAMGIGLMGLFSLQFFGLIPLLFGFMFIKTDRSEIDLNSKAYRNIKSFVGIKVVKWKPLPNIDYVSVFTTTENITVRALTAETRNAFPIIHLNLFYANNKKITIYQTKNKTDAFNVASKISKVLSIDILDATEKGDFKWIEKN